MVKAHAQSFGFLHSTDTLPLGKIEFELQETSRVKKYPGGNYWLQDNLLEQSYGLRNNLEVSLKEAMDYTSAYHNGPYGATTPPEQFVYFNPGPKDHFNKWRLIGISEELKYRIQSPYINDFGFAAIEECTFGAGFIEPEFKFIVQKDFDHDLLVFVANASYKPEFRWVADTLNPSQTVFQEETDANIYLGASYRFTKSWFVMAELLNEREFNSYTFTHLSNSGYYLGPTIDYEGEHFFISASIYEQMPWAVRHSDTVPGGIVNGRIVDNDFEQYRIRIKAGWHF